MRTIISVIVCVFFLFLLIINASADDSWFIYEEDASWVSTNITGWLDMVNFFDGDWSTKGWSNAEMHEYYYFNYPIRGDSSDHILQFREEGGYVNITINSTQYTTCLRNDGYLNFYHLGFNNYHGAPEYYDLYEIYCLDNDNTPILIFENLYNGGNYYEDGLFYNVSNMSSCNENNLGLGSCGGYNMQMVLTCENATELNGSVKYDWSPKRKYCEDGCYEGSCVDSNSSCTDMCLFNTTKCINDFVYRCVDANDDGCYEYSLYNKTYCDNGCFNGKCVGEFSLCTHNSKKCDSGFIWNCTKNDKSLYVWDKLFNCEYGCDYEYLDGEIINATCNEVGDAHETLNSILSIGSYINFVFKPIILMVYIFLVIVATIIVSHKVEDGNIGFWMFIFGIGIGTFIGVIPMVYSFVIIMLSVAIKMYGGRTYE